MFERWRHRRLRRRLQRLLQRNEPLPDDLREHVRGCPTCRRQYNVWRQVESVVFGEAAAERFAAGVERTDEPRPGRVRWLVPAAGVLAVAVAAIVWLPNRTDRDTGWMPRGAVQDAELEPGIRLFAGPDTTHIREIVVVDDHVLVLGPDEMLQVVYTNPTSQPVLADLRIRAKDQSFIVAPVELAPHAVTPVAGATLRPEDLPERGMLEARFYLRDSALPQYRQLLMLRRIPIQVEP